MRAVRFDATVGSFLAARSLGRWADVFTFGRLGAARLTEVALPALPDADWVELDVLGCGICGTDLGVLTFDGALALEPFNSFPAVPGHEVLARVSGVGAGVGDLHTGQRVVLDPSIGCVVRGIPGDDHDRWCREGRPFACSHAAGSGRVVVAGEPLGPGMSIGFQRQLPGGWGERMVAHRSQLYPVPDAVDDRAAVLVEPLSIATHAVLTSGLVADATAPLQPELAEGPVLVVGSGTIALATVWALRALGFAGDITVQAKRPHERALAERLGATGAVPPDQIDSVLRSTGARAHRRSLGPDVWLGGGFSAIFDCVGNASSLQLALAAARERARIVLLGCATQLRDLDLTMLWARELTVAGATMYGRERWRGRELHTHEVVLDRLVAREAPIGELVTHAFPLSELGTALRTAADHRRSHAIKVVLTETPERFRR